jgi:hypothetical protein
MSDKTYYHNHHIIPRHAGGSNDASNLVMLTIAEHAEAHRLLYEERGRYQDKVAWLTLSGQITKAEATRKIQSEQAKNRIYTDEMKRNMSEGQKGKKYDRKGKCGAEKNNFYGKTHSDEAKLAMRQKHLGKKFSEETKRKMSAATKGIAKPKLTCPHCGLLGGAPQMKRHHFDNCKEK